MPVHKVRGGYRWGTHGKVYKNRAGAERQARAIYASGWRENKKDLAHALKASPKAETRYVLDLIRIMRGVHKGVFLVVKKEFTIRQDSDEDDELEEAVAEPEKIGLGARLLALIAAWTKPLVEVAFNRMAEDVTIRVEGAMGLIGIDPMHVAGIASYVEHARQANVELIRNASEDFLQQVRDVLREMEGRPAKDVAAALQERARVSRSRAELIGRAQVLKMNSAIIQHRARAAGISKYRWSTSMDERVRPMHAELEGQVFTWDDPPVTNPQGETNHPGEDYQCRCLPIVLVDEN